MFKKVKTGPLPINVSYELQVLRCKPDPLTEEDLAKLEEFGDIDSHFPRPTVEELEKLIQKVLHGDDEAPTEETEAASSSETEAVQDLS